MSVVTYCLYDNRFIPIQNVSYNPNQGFGPKHDVCLNNSDVGICIRHPNGHNMRFLFLEIIIPPPITNPNIRTLFCRDCNVFVPLSHVVQSGSSAPRHLGCVHNNGEVFAYIRTLNGFHLAFKFDQNLQFLPMAPPPPPPPPPPPVRHGVTGSKNPPFRETIKSGRLYFSTRYGRSEWFAVEECVLSNTCSLCSTLFFG